MIVQTDESSSAACKRPVTVQKRCQQAGRSRRAVQQRRRRGRRSFVVVCDARAASELSSIAVVSASRPCLPTVGLSPGSSVQSGCNSQVSHHRPCRGREPCRRLGQGKSGRQRGTATDQMDKRSTLNQEDTDMHESDAGSYQLSQAHMEPSHILHRAVNSQDVIKMSDGHRNVVIRYCLYGTN